MRHALGRDEHAANLPGLGMPVTALLEIERTQHRVPVDAMAAHLADLLEAELTAETERLLETEPVRRASRLLEELRVDRHADVRRTPGARLAQCMAAEYGRLSVALEDGRDSLAEADAHGGDPEAAAASSELVEEGCGQARAARSERMPEGHGAAVRVELLGGNAELADLLCQPACACRKRSRSLPACTPHGTVRNRARHGNVHPSPAARRARRPVS